MNSFREVPLIPSKEELLTKELPSLPSNVDNKFEDVEHYLDTHFRLLREDFVRPIREAISEYQSKNAAGDWCVDKIENAYFYKNVTVYSYLSNFADRGLQLRMYLDFDSVPLSLITQGRRLIFGSVVCFSWNNFNDMVIATISNSLQEFERRKFKDYFDVTIDSQKEEKFLDILRLNPDTKVTVIEPVVYFEAYRHNLRVLQLLNEESFPLARYIIDLNTDILSPAYLSEDTIFDFSHFLTPLKLNDGFTKEIEFVNCSDQLKSVNLLNTNNWPTLEQLRMDQSEYESLKNVFTNEIAIVQGPPGTGKTHIGLRIVQTMIVNVGTWDFSGDSSILIVCYTNHALDQFLEGVLTFTNRLLRIGSRSQSKALQNYTLRQTRMKHKHCGCLKDLRNKSKLEQDLHFARYAKVIGVTSTGAAKYRDLISALKPKIVIVEEAAEILEAHLITSLTESAQHLILIGDHHQLKPAAFVYELAVKHNLNVSLFERLIRNKLSYTQLKVQHRMHPNISKVLIPIFYKELENHEKVTKYEKIKGVINNVFFVAHKVLESACKATTSKSNTHELQFVVALARHLVLQGYKPTQITILSLYSEQYFDIKRVIIDQEELKGLRVAILDNYQGEENDIVICSFVRSNEEGSIGFLNVSNRISVALSRAKIAFYGIGNFEKMAEVCKNLWTPLLNHLKNNGYFGYALELQCQNHTDQTYFVSSGSDFNRFPNGCCSKPCGRKFNCGHICLKSCHVLGADHSQSLCQQECLSQLCEYGHRCRIQCHYPDSCPPCSILLDKNRLCGHVVKISCSMAADEVICTERCDKLISCGHRCSLRCGQECSEKECVEMVAVKLACEHRPTLVPCNNQRKLQDLLKLCREPCKVILKCGHQCSGTCGECKQGRFHKRCNEECGRVLLCGHICKHPCANNCPPCTAPCVNTCPHNSNCEHDCGSRCPPCKQRCLWKCEHIQCTMLCSEPCDRDFCEQSCNKKLPCGHDCIGLCGEPCPTLCRVCNKNEVEELFFGNENLPDAKFVQLIDCGHIFEFEAITTYMRQNGNQIKMKPCPRCQTIIRTSYLFNREIQAAMSNIEAVKAKTSMVASFAECLYIVKSTKSDANHMLIQFRRLKSHGRMNHELIQTLKHIVKEQIVAIEDPRIFFSKSKLVKIKTIIDVCGTVLKFYNPEYNNEAIAAIFYQRLLDILTFISTDFHNNDQQSYDLKKELDIVVHVGKCLILTNDSQVCHFEHFEELFQEAFDIFCENTVLTDEKYTRLKYLTNEAFQLRTGIGVSIEDTISIMKAMNFAQKGHWFKCPQNHIYCITECGGAEEKGVCPECKSAIGGSGHRLLESNSVATEMDGAISSAYDYLARQLDNL